MSDYLHSCLLWVAVGCVVIAATLFVIAAFVAMFT